MQKEKDITECPTYLILRYDYLYTLATISVHFHDIDRLITTLPQYGIFDN